MDCYITNNSDEKVTGCLFTADKLKERYTFNIRAEISWEREGWTNPDPLSFKLLIKDAPVIASVVGSTYVEVNAN